MPGIQAISFDVGGTLIKPWPSVGDVYAAVATESGFAGLKPEDLNRHFASAWNKLGNRAESRDDWAAVVKETFRHCAINSDLLFESLYSRFMEPSVWRIFDDVIPTLKALKSGGVSLAIASNWDERLRPLLDRLGLMNYFDVVIVSCEVGCRKPESAFFQKVQMSLDLPPSEMIHVGDSEEHDLLGARNAGMHALGIRRNLPRADLPWISSLSNLLDFQRVSDTCMNKHT